MMTAEQIVKAVLSGEKTAQSITQETLAVIAQKNPSINAFVEVFEQDALAQAKEIDAKKARGENWARWQGFPLLSKTIFFIKGIKLLVVPKCWKIMWLPILLP